MGCVDYCTGPRICVNHKTCHLSFVICPLPLEPAAFCPNSPLRNLRNLRTIRCRLCPNRHYFYRIRPCPGPPRVPAAFSRPCGAPKTKNKRKMILPLRYPGLAPRGYYQAPHAGLQREKTNHDGPLAYPGGAPGCYVAGLSGRTASCRRRGERRDHGYKRRYVGGGRGAKEIREHQVRSAEFGVRSERQDSEARRDEGTKARRQQQNGNGTVSRRTCPARVLDVAVCGDG